MTDFIRFRINSDQVAAEIGRKGANLHNEIVKQFEFLVNSATAFVIQKAQAELPDNLRKKYLETTAGSTEPKHVHKERLGDGLWVIYLDEEIRYIEEGASSIFMEWLLSKNAKTKVAKDGSRYAHIPMGQKRGAGGRFSNPNADLEKMIQGALKTQGISLNKIERDAAGKPLTGILHKLDVKEPSRDQFASLFSKPRSVEDAARLGLNPHSGIFYLKGAVVTQHQNEKGKTVKEVITFRTISDKHKAEGRWMTKPVKALNAIPAAQEFVEKTWRDVCIPQIEATLKD